MRIQQRGIAELRANSRHARIKIEAKPVLRGRSSSEKLGYGPHGPLGNVLVTRTRVWGGFSKKLPAIQHCGPRRRRREHVAATEFKAKVAPYLVEAPEL